MNQYNEIKSDHAEVKSNHELRAFRSVVYGEQLGVENNALLTPEQ